MRASVRLGLGLGCVLRGGSTHLPSPGLTAALTALPSLRVRFGSPTCLGKMGHEMFFLMRGRVEVLHRGSRYDDQPAIKVCELNAGDYFGEIALLNSSLPGLNPNRRVATIRAIVW